MQVHWKALQWATIVALGAFIISMMAESYALTYGVLVTAFIAVTAYAISVARFRDRSDTDDKGRPPRAA